MPDRTNTYIHSEIHRYVVGYKSRYDKKARTLYATLYSEHPPSQIAHVYERAASLRPTGYFPVILTVPDTGEVLWRLNPPPKPKKGKKRARNDR